MSTFHGCGRDEAGVEIKIDPRPDDQDAEASSLPYCRIFNGRTPALQPKSNSSSTQSSPPYESHCSTVSRTIWGKAKQSRKGFSRRSQTKHQTALRSAMKAGVSRLHRCATRSDFTIGS